MRYITIEVEIKEIKELISALNAKIDMLIETRETLPLMVLAQKSLKDFLEEEPDIYSINDVKVKYR